MPTLATDPHLDLPPPPSRRVRVVFDPDTVPMDEARGTLELARMAAESLHGAVAVALDAEYGLDADHGTAWVDTTSDVGRTLAMLFVGYAQREFGGVAVRVERTADAGSNERRADR